jgi:glycosyltransferase involved in cell wall biosynthesis
LNPSNETLSVLLLVRDAQANLAGQVERLIETASELTTRFDVVIIDDASTDATEEIAWELSARHAQVQLIRQPRPQGPVAALKAGLSCTSGQWVLVSDGNGAPADEALSVLWRQRHGEVVPFGSRGTDANWLERLLRSLRGQPPIAVRAGNAQGWRLLRRSELDRHDAAWHNATV